MRMEEAIDALGEPYPGLRPFRRDETHIFFGREDTISEMVDRLAAHHFLAVTGTSGSGKSSLVKTGLLDALERALLVEAGSDWRVVDFRPGGQPLRRMTQELTRALEETVSDQELSLIEAKLATGPMGLVAWLDEVNFPSETNILLLVDQFEEIFRYREGRGGDDIDAFVALLIASARQRKRPVYVVITMRSDFLGDCARFTDLAETINDGQFLTPRLTRDQCEEAIEGPAKVYEGEVEPALVTRMLNDMGGNPDQLPLMQHLLMRLWQRAKARSPTKPVLTLDDYKTLGGIGTGRSEADKFVAVDGKRPSLLQRIFGRSAATGARAATTGVHSINGALSDHADSVLAELTAEQQRLAEILFRALTQSEGEGGRDVRRPITLAKAAAIAQVPASDLIPIIKAFGAPGRNFLTPAEPDARAAETTTIDISHESLIRQWVTLRRWVHREFVSAENYRHIERSAKQWQIGLGNRLMKLDLAMARRWQKDEHPNAVWADRYGDSFDFAMEFLRKSLRRERWRKGIAAFAAITVGSLVLVATGIATYLTVVMTSGLSYFNPADEWTNFDVRPQGELRRQIATNTPPSIPGGQVIRTGALETAIKHGTLEGVPFLLIDALRRAAPPPRAAIPGAKYIEYAGNYGSFDDNVQERLKSELGELTNGNLDMPLVFFCEGAKCWESYNACLRAITLGYRKVYWYRGGIESWKVAHRAYDIEFSRIPAKWPEVIPTYRAIRQALWPDPDYHYRRGLDYQESRKYDLAVYDFTDAIGRNPSHVDAYYQRALAYMRTDEYEAALDDFSKVAELAPERKAEIQATIADPKFAVGYNARGETYHRKRDYDRAIQEFTQAIQLDPKLALAYANRGSVHYDRGDNDLALQDFDAAIRLDSKNSKFYNGRGHVYLRMADHDRAIEDYGLAIKLSPKIAIYYISRGYSYFRKGNYDSAIADYDEAIKLDPTASRYGDRGYLHVANGNLDLAIQDYSAAISLDPTNADYYGGRGNAYLRDGKHDLAIQDYDQAIRLRPKDVESYYHARGKAYSDKRDYDRAIKDYHQAIALDPKFAEAYGDRGDTLYYKEDYDAAIADYLRAIELGLNNAVEYERLGRAYFAKHDFERAIQEYGKAIGLQPSNANARAGRALAELYAGRIEPAIVDLAAAVKAPTSHAYHAIWLHMARMRAGRVDLEELAANTEKIDRALWPWPLVGLFLGAAAPETIHPAARSAGDPGERDDQVCKADFYLGFYRAANGEREQARQLFQAVVMLCPRHNMEHQLGRIELERLR
jgi:PQQ-dependent catabolism-associated CXXCW motif protein